MSLRKVFLTSCVLAAGALALPVADNTTMQLATRATSYTPMISTGFTDEEVNQIKAGFGDAIELASYIITDTSQEADNILKKYFAAGDLDVVKNVYKTILGGPANDPPGNQLLSQITISKDFPNSKGNLACSSDKNVAAMRNYKTKNPIIILCPRAFKFPSQRTSFPDLPVPTCESLDALVSWKMATLGATLLHEYTHWKKLVTGDGLLAAGTVDLVYGPYKTRNLAKAQAKTNADNYRWAALEHFWSEICSVEYDDPTKASSNNPNCDNAVCELPLGA